MATKKKLAVVQTRMKKAPELKALAKVEAEKVVSLAKVVDKLTVKSDDDFTKATSLVAEIKTHKKNTEKARKSITDPLDQAKKATMALFNPITKGLDQLIEIVDKKIVGYIDVKAAEAQKAVAKEVKMLEKKGLGDMARDLQRDAAKEAIPAVDGTFIRSSWHAELMDLVLLVQAAELELRTCTPERPPEILNYLTLNEKYANGVARLLKDAKKAPAGVRFMEEKYTQSGGPAFGEGV